MRQWIAPARASPAKRRAHQMAAKQKKSGSKSKKKGGKRKGGLPKAYIREHGSLKAAWRAYKQDQAKGKKKKSGGKKKAKAKKPKKAKKAKSKARESKKPAKKKKSGKKTSRRKSPDLSTVIARNKAELSTLEARYESKRVALNARLAKASDAEKARLTRKMEQLLAERDQVIARQKAKAMRDAERIKELEAAETKRHGKKRKKGKRKKNPITGWGESLSTVGGVTIGGILLVVGDSLISNRGNLQTTAAGLADVPAANGGVYMLSAQSLPVWKQFKHAGAFRILWALANTGLPLWGAHMANKANHKKLAAFLQGWGYTDVGIAVAKVSTDGLAMLLGKKQIGFKAFPAQLAAVNMAAAASAANTPLTPVTVAPGTSGKLGYGATSSAGVLGAGKAGCEHVGAGKPCCSNCAQSKQVKHGGAPQQPNCPPGGSPPAPSAAPSAPLNGQTYNTPSAPAAPSTPGIPYSNANSPPSTSPSTLGAQGAEKDNVTSIVAGKKKNSALRAAGTGTRFDRSKFGL